MMDISTLSRCDRGPLLSFSVSCTRDLSGLCFLRSTQGQGSPQWREPEYITQDGQDIAEEHVHLPTVRAVAVVIRVVVGSSGVECRTFRSRV